MIDIPEEILYEIFSYLESPQDLIWASEACWTWNRVVHDQKRLWFTVDLSNLNSIQLGSLSWQMIWTSDSYTCPRSLVYKLNRASSVQVLHPTCINACDFELLHPLIVHNEKLTSFGVERIQITEENVWGAKLLKSVPVTLTDLSLRQTLMKPRTLSAVLGRLPFLKSLDLSYTNAEDSTLKLISKMNHLEQLILDMVYNLSDDGLREFLLSDAPTSIQRLSVKQGALDANWIFNYIKRQIKSGMPTLTSIELQGCYWVTIKDIELLNSLTNNSVMIKHTAVLTEDTLDGYRELIERLSAGMVISGSGT